MFRFLFVIAMNFFADRVFAEWENDLTSPGFKVDLSKLDPVHPWDVNGSNLQWTWALVYLLWKVAELLLFAIPILAGIAFLVAGYYFILASGNSEKATQAKMIIKWNLIAMLVAFLSYWLVKIVLSIMSL